MPIALLTLLSLVVFVSAISCGDNKCEELIFELTDETPSLTKEINGHSEIFTYELREEEHEGHIGFTPLLLINGESYPRSYDPLFNKKGYRPNGYSVIYTGEMVTYEIDGKEYKNEKPSGIKVRIKELDYCTATDCRKTQSIINVEKGWNLIQWYSVWYQHFAQTSCNLNSGGYGFFYDPFKKNYTHTYFSSSNNIKANLYQPDFDMNWEEFLEKKKVYQFYGDLNSFWVYSEESCKITLNYPDYYDDINPPDGLQLFSDNTGGNSRKLSQGWNFLSVYTLLKGNNLEGIKGDCSFEKAYFFNAKNQDWEQVQLDYKFSSSDIGKGIVVKTISECTPEFKIGSSSQPPLIPN